MHLIISCEHATNHVPENYRHVFADDATILTTHEAYDLGALTVAKHCRGLAEFACYGNITRLLIDFNRSPTHQAIFSRFSQCLSAADRQDLQANYYTPYRQNLLKHLQAGVAAGHIMLHIAVHSFTPLWHDSLRPVELGLLYDPKRSQEAYLAKQWQSKLRALMPDWRVRRNSPYRGVSDGITTWLRRELPLQQYVGFELEINQTLLTTEVAAQDVAQWIYQSLLGLK